MTGSNKHAGTGHNSIMQESGEDGAAKLWALWRQDDNGNRFLVSVSRTRPEAQQELNLFEKMRHKQCYWVEPYKG